MNTGQMTQCEYGKSVAASGTVSRDESFFQDHFPDFPVLPGVLMLEILKQTAERYFEKEMPQARFRLAEIRNVRYSNFLKPGESWESKLQHVAENQEFIEWKGRLVSQGQPVCSARLKFQRLVF